MADPNEALVQTPHGLVPASKVIAVKPHEAVLVHENGHLVTVDRVSGSITMDYGKVSQEALDVTDPRAYATKLRNEYLRSKGLPEQADEEYPGYTVTAIPDIGMTPISEFHTSWTVPPVPSEAWSVSTFSIWNGMDGGKLQPVLKWSFGAYQITNWAYVGGAYVYGSSQLVDPGDSLTGIVTLNSSGFSWGHSPKKYTVSFANYPDLDLVVGRADFASSVAECFETTTSELSQIPNSPYVAMQNIKVVLGANMPVPDLDWSVSGTPLSTPSGKNTVIVDSSATDGEIDFYFQ